MTKYRVLASTSEGLDVLAREVEAHGPQQAMRAVAATELPEDVLAEGITLVAVPVSNWTEEHVKLAPQKPRLVVGAEPSAQVTVEEAIAEVEAEPVPEEETTDGD